MINDTWARGAGCHGGLEPEPVRSDQVIDDPGQQLLQGGRLLVVEALQRLELLRVELRAGFLAQVDDGIERSGCRTDDCQPSLERQILATLPIDSLPDTEDRDFRVNDQAVEVEHQRFDGSHRLRWKNSRRRRSRATRSRSERDMWRSFG